MERNLLQELNIPKVDFEVYGCPKYDACSRPNICNLLPGCYFYLEESIHHCPVKECYAFWCWSTMNVVQNRHFVIFLVMAFREMWAGFKKPGFLFGKIEKSLVR